MKAAPDKPIMFRNETDKTAFQQAFDLSVNCPHIDDGSCFDCLYATLKEKRRT